MLTIVEVTETVVGYHQWEEAPAHLEFLRYPHRHRFIIHAARKVEGADREVEFFTFQQEIRDYLCHLPNVGNDVDFRGLSCEMIAAQLVRDLGLIYCSASEDGENRAIVIAEGETGNDLLLAN